MKLCAWTDNVPCKSHRISSKNPNIRPDKSPFVVVSQGSSSDSPKPNGSIDTAFGCLSDIESKSPLKKTSYTLGVGLRWNIRAGFNLKASFL